MGCSDRAHSRGDRFHSHHRYLWKPAWKPRRDVPVIHRAPAARNADFDSEPQRIECLGVLRLSNVERNYDKLQPDGYDQRWTLHFGCEPYDLRGRRKLYFQSRSGLHALSFDCGRCGLDDWNYRRAKLDRVLIHCAGQRHRRRQQFAASDESHGPSDVERWLHSDASGSAI